MRNLFRKMMRMLLWAVLIGGAVLLLPRLLAALHAKPRMFTGETAPSRRVAVVFGAGLRGDGTATPILRDRVEAAARLFFDGKVEKLLMSGDNRFIYYNEPQAMHDYAVSLGVPENAIVLDYAGRSTYETCYRALAIFGVQDPILVTQSFHLARALYTCDLLGLDAVGVRADLRTYRRSSLLIWNTRELFATLKAFWEVHVERPMPVLGEEEPIFPPQTHIDTMEVEWIALKP